MTKRFHKCDDSCKHIEEKPKVVKKTVKKPKILKKEIKPEVVNEYANKPNTAKIEAIWKIINMFIISFMSLLTIYIIKETFYFL